jgi:hypothetical protein
VAAYGYFLLVALVVTWPLAIVMTTRFAGHPFGDSYEYIRHIWWINHALQTGQPILWQPLLAYPTGMDGTLLWSYPLQSFPAWLFAYVMPMPAAYNVALLLRLALNGWSAYWLARYLTGGQLLPALIAGTIFMAYSTMQGHLGAGHTGLLALWPVPLYAYALFRLRQTGRWRYVLLAALFFVLSAWGSTQLLIFTTLPITAVFALVLVFRREWVRLSRVLGAVVLGAAGTAPFALPLYLSTLQTPPYVRLTTGVVDYSADLLAIAAPSFYHPLFRDNPISTRVLGIDPFEGATYASSGALVASGRPGGLGSFAGAAIESVLSAGQRRDRRLSNLRHNALAGACQSAVRQYHANARTLQLPRRAVSGDDGRLWSRLRLDTMEPPMVGRRDAGAASSADRF